MTRFIGITGYKRSGKDTIAGVLVEEGFTRIGFADPLKGMAYATDPYVQVTGLQEDYHRLRFVVDSMGWERAKEYADVRRFLQLLGTEGVRDHLGNDAWVNALKLAAEPFEKVVVPDVRFPNEASAIREWGGEIWKVHRPGCESDGHASEAYIAGIDADLEFYNVGDIPELRAAATLALE